MTVVLVGLPASGKSTVGPLLARYLGESFVDVDQVIEEHTGQTIPEIFAEGGEAAFRAVEAETALDLLPQGGVIALGGGAVTGPVVRQALAGLSVVWLTVGEDEALARADGGARPLLDEPEAWLRLARERHGLYASVASLRVDTTGLTPDEVARHIASELGEREERP